LSRESSSTQGEDIAGQGERQVDSERAGPDASLDKDSGSLSIKPPRGTRDILPAESPQWQHLENCARTVLPAAGYGEIRVPIFEHTEIFKRGVGETTDIVNKEMYTFPDKSERSLTLRPEGTAGVVRAYLNGGLHRQAPPVKFWYAGPMFRYERAQTGRQRQFHQIGIEAFGSAGPLIDAEVIGVAVDYMSEVGVSGFELQINSIGCPVCRPAYRNLLKEHLRPLLPELCDDCRERFERNPLRMLDCKSQNCQSHYQDVPASIDHLCQECQLHWDQLLVLLAELNVAGKINTRLVRGLDYYTRTVFELVSGDPRLGAQTTICAGGRYDNLVELFGGPPTPAVGWALGMERVHLLMSDEGKNKLAAFVVSSQPAKALALASQLRRAGISCDLDFPGRGADPRAFSKQLQQANKLGASWAIILGEEELRAGEATLKNMESGVQIKLPLTELVRHLQSGTDQMRSV